MSTHKSGDALPDWLVRHLQTIGAMGNDRIGRRAHPSRCVKCRRLVLTGLDNDRCAWVAIVDPLPLAPMGEVLALLSGRRTYTLHVGVGVCELQARDQWQIAGSPAGVRYDVYPAHVCEWVHLPQAPSVHRLPLSPPALPPY